MSDTTPSSPTTQPTGVPFAYRGPVIAILILVLVVIFGGLYLWGTELRSTEEIPAPERTLPNNEPETPRAVTDKHILDTVSTSKDLDAIYADLHSTNLGSLTHDLDTVLKELGSL